MEWVTTVPFTLPRNMVYPALLPLMRTPRLPVVDWNDAPAYLNGIVRFAERRNLVSARVPSHFKSSLPLLPSQLRNTKFSLSWTSIIILSCLKYMKRPLHLSPRNLPIMIFHMNCLEERLTMHKRFVKRKSKIENHKPICCSHLQVKSRYVFWTAELTLWPWNWTFK